MIINTIHKININKKYRNHNILSKIEKNRKNKDNNKKKDYICSVVQLIAPEGIEIKR